MIKVCYEKGIVRVYQNDVLIERVSGMEPLEVCGNRVELKLTLNLDKEELKCFVNGKEFNY